MVLKVETLEEVKTGLLALKKRKEEDVRFQEWESITAFVLKEEIKEIDRTLAVVDGTSEIEVKNTLLSHIANQSESKELHEILKSYLKIQRVPVIWEDL